MIMANDRVDLAFDVIQQCFDLIAAAAGALQHTVHLSQQVGQPGLHQSEDVLQCRLQTANHLRCSPGYLTGQIAAQLGERLHQRLHRRVKRSQQRFDEAQRRRTALLHQLINGVQQQFHHLFEEPLHAGDDALQCGGQAVSEGGARLQQQVYNTGD
ncbi:hypothetical protein TYRP_017189 [Tyrophagus putrescentiae]|nr:hypothetical protein TYRP_017189 [Tyrophagus putrescentiae]